MKGDALVVGGSIHTRLAQREALPAEGFNVTLEGSTRRGLTRLGQHPFTLCTLDLSDTKQPRDWKRKYGAQTSVRGTQLRVLTRVERLRSTTASSEAL